MPRQLRKQKAYIVVFCEGESERAYMEFGCRGFQI